MQKELERLKQEAAEADEEGRKELNLTIEVPSSNKHYYVLTERQPAPVRLWEYGTFLKAEKEKVIVADTLGSQWVEWQMIPGEKREILGFQCKKAVGTFRGRRYVAWYCPEIPVPYGPWKLYGLPGLILEAYDESHQIAFLPEKIELNTAVSIPAELPEAKQVSFEEYLKMAEKRAKKLTRYSGSVSENSVKIEGLELRGRDYFIKIK
jgi:GLPGLI family protein